MVLYMMMILEKDGKNMPSGGSFTPLKTPKLHENNALKLGNAISLSSMINTIICTKPGLVASYL